MTRIEEIEARKAEIALEVEAENADLDKLEEEVRSLNAEVETIKANAEKRQALRDSISAGAGEIIEKFEMKEERKMENIEIRNSKEYIDAYAEYIKSGDATECRKLLTTNATVATGTVAVPEIVEGYVRTAWEREGITSRVRKSYLKGNVKIGFEIDSDPAYAHSEGDTAVAEEDLELGVVKLTPVSIKKWISISDEAMDLTGEEFLRYIYDELTYQIAKKAADVLVGKIVALPATATANTVSAQKVTAAPAVGTVASALGVLSDRASNPAVIMNKATWSLFKAAQYANGFNADPFEGLEVIFNNSLPAYASATAGAVYAIVGDLYVGAQANFPNGDEMTFKFDDLTLATEDLVRIIGRQFIGIDAVAPNAFALIAKPSAE